MKTTLRFLFIFTLTFLTLFNRSNAQVLQWSNVFDVHSAGGLAGLTPNSLSDNIGKISTVVIENDTLKLYQTSASGTVTNSYITNKKTEDNYTPLVRVAGDQQALVFKDNQLPASFWLLQTDADLNVIREDILEFPSGMPFIDVQDLIEYNGELYLSFFSQPLHYLCKINDDNTLSVIYSGNYEIAFGVDHIILDNGNIVFSYKIGNGHIIRCVSVDSGVLVWEQTIKTDHGFLLDYKIVRNENILYTVGRERAWVNGEGNDKVIISFIDVFSGAILFQEPLDLPPCNNCGAELNDFLYNTANNRLYLSYESEVPQAAMFLIELDDQSAQIISAKNFPFEREIEPFQLDKRSVTHVKPDGSLVFMYRSYKNATEQMNLYITRLNSELESLGTFEFHVEELESTEHPTDVLSYDASRILITGVIPNKDPSISIERVGYFMAMIDLGELLSTEDPAGTSQGVVIYPNPANNKVNFVVPDGVYELTIFDSLGKITHKEKVTQKTFDIDVSSYQSGIYFVNFSGQQGGFNKKLIIR
ncbi:T9SS type A sorting domain-containing protein [Moheibacter sediminis]|uniref:Por secretion system C-terminal sorting domain-containing protein n=1 Tax=Moheibacter sediminis TaxID=1434700 RepID=A0A1W2B5B1_9FLAO|nr:T9SS type A sorting domain-containing protein [Moheibacter sediminis]SMC67960.1 Por secretion system C-terminal sorting domain-containing protein [Moheibacter sediminis]